MGARPPSWWSTRRRVGWMFRVNRTLGGHGGCRRLATFAADFGGFAVALGSRAHDHAALGRGAAIWTGWYTRSG